MISLIEYKGTKIAEIQSGAVVIASVQDALDLMADCGYQGASRILVREEHIAPEFFDLSSGLAGEILQKFSNYRVNIAIVGDFSGYSGKSFRDFIRESNRMKRINFVASMEEARDVLAGD